MFLLILHQKHAHLHLLQWLFKKRAFILLFFRLDLIWFRFDCSVFITRMEGNPYGVSKAVSTCNNRYHHSLLQLVYTGNFFGSVFIIRTKESAEVTEKEMHFSSGSQCHFLLLGSVFCSTFMSFDFLFKTRSRAPTLVRVTLLVWQSHADFSVISERQNV